MKQSEYIELDGVALAERIERKEVSLKEVIDASFKRLAKVNDQLNAVTYTRNEQAYEEAEQKQQQEKPNDRSFFGVPIFLKDISQTIKGELSTGGANLLKNSRAFQTSNFVQMLLQAGFISLGNSMTPEFALKNITEPKLYGPTRNPWNRDYSPGGSSGGAASLVASGVVPIAGASDGGGSIRIPASFSGIVGLKPTRGRTAVGPGVGRQWHGAAVDFVLTKSVRDAARSLDRLKIVQSSAAFQTPLYPMAYEDVMQEAFNRPLKIGFTTKSPVHTPVSADAVTAVNKVIAFLASLGHEVEEVDVAIDGEQLMREYYLMNSGEIRATMEQLEETLGRPITDADVEVETWVLNRAGENVSAATFSRSLAAWDVASEKMAAFHETYDFYITPATAYPAPKIGALTFAAQKQAYLREEIERRNSKEQQDLIYEMFLPSLTYTPFTQLANLTGQPAISLPVHLTNEGLPLGVQVIAPKGNEHMLLKLADKIEQSSLWVHLKDSPIFANV